MMLKFACILGCLFALARCSPRPQDITLKQLRDSEIKCVAKYPNLSREYLEEMKRNRKIPDDAPPELMCMMDCMGRDLGIIDDEGNYHFERLKFLTIDITGGTITHDEAHAKVTKCIQADHPEACEKANQYVRCKADELKDVAFHKDFCETCS